MVKQIIIVRKDIKMGKGKTAAQVAHASLGAYKKAKKLSPKLIAEWESEGEKKVVLKGTLEDLINFKQWADAKKIPSYMVSDAGRTQLAPGTVTTLGIGPEKDEELKETKILKLL